MAGAGSGQTRASHPTASRPDRGATTRSPFSILADHVHQQGRGREEGPGRRTGRWHRSRSAAPTFHSRCAHRNPAPRSDAARLPRPSSRIYAQDRRGAPVRLGAPRSRFLDRSASRTGNSTPARSRHKERPHPPDVASRPRRSDTRDAPRRSTRVQNAELNEAPRVGFRRPAPPGVRLFREHPDAPGAGRKPVPATFGRTSLRTRTSRSGAVRLLAGSHRSVMGGGRRR